MGIGAHELSVVLPTKDEAGNIERFLRSLPADVELIVVDSSVDETVSIIERTRPEHTTILRRDVNIPTARQLGADAATTPWLLFTDADVVFEPWYFASLDTVPIAAETGGLVGAKGTLGGYDLYHRTFLMGQRALMALNIPAASGSNMLVRRRALRDVGGFDRALSVNEDTELMFRLQRQGWAVRFRPDLAVLSFDHRRLEAGVLRKLAHGAVRNTALYLGVFGGAVRRSDWGYFRAGRRHREVTQPS